MTVFGPRYAQFPRLQRAVNHAERAWALLVDIDTAIDTLRDESGTEVEGEELRFCGRASELLVYVSATLEAWRQGATDQEAQDAIESFIHDHVHTLLRARFGMVPECCSNHDECTVARPIAFLEEPTLAGTYAQVLTVPSGEPQEPIWHEPPSRPDAHVEPTAGRRRDEERHANAVVRLSAWTDRQRIERS